MKKILSIVLCCAFSSFAAIIECTNEHNKALLHINSDHMSGYLNDEKMCVDLSCNEIGLWLNCEGSDDNIVYRITLLNKYAKNARVEKIQDDSYEAYGTLICQEIN
jgi:hypothetical protein